MKIAFPAFVLDGGKTGISMYVVNLLKSLSGIDAVNRYEIFISKSEEILLPQLGPNFVKKPSLPAVLNPILNICWHNTVLPMVALKDKIDLVHIPSIRRIPVIKSCPLVATVHDLAPMYFPKKYDPLRLFYHRHILRKLIHRCDRIITISHHVKSDIIKYTGYPQDKIRVIYHGIDHDIFRPMPSKKKQPPFFVYVSRLEHPAKNHVNLIKAFELFKKKFHTEHRLFLAGADWNGAQAIKDYAAGSAAGKDIQFLGFVPQDEIVSLYSNCDLMIFPSFHEGFGFPVLEAMACGACVICSNTTSLKEIAQGQAQLFNPADPQDICHCMAQALSNRYSSIGYTTRFDWKNTAREVLEVYQEALK